MIYDIAKQFNRACATYDEASSVQQRVGLSLITAIKEWGHYFSEVIDLGCGSGLTTLLLAANIEYQHFHAIDIANNFLAVAESKFSNYAIQCFNKNFDDHYPCDQYALVFSNFALHWSQNLSNTLCNIKQHMKPKGLLAMTIPLFGTYQTLPYPHKNFFYREEEVIWLLKSAGFKNINSEIISYQTTHVDFVAGLKSIKAMGANYLFADKMMPNQLFSLRSLKGDQQPFILNYHVGFFIVSY